MKKDVSCISKLVCTNCKKDFELIEKHTVCKSCGKVLFPEYDLERAKETLSKKSIERRNKFNIWRINEIMPVTNPDWHFTLGEGWTPVLSLRNQPKLKNVFLKDEGQNPTGTFKCRGLCAAISKGYELGIRDFAIPTAGNAGVALSAYTACTKTNAHVFMPEDTPYILQCEVIAMGGKVNLVPGLITDAAEECKKMVEGKGLFDVSTLKEPYRVEGKKTMALEIVEQFGWNIPDVIIYPTGGGTGIVGMWKGFDELETIGLIGSERPRMISVQSSGCAPIVKAFQEGKASSSFWENAKTIAPGLCVPKAIGDYLILKAINESKGTAVAIEDSEIFSAMKKLAKTEGIMQSPEGASCFACIEKLLEEDNISPSDSVVLYGTGAGIIYPNLWNKERKVL